MCLCASIGESVCECALKSLSVYPTKQQFPPRKHLRAKLQDLGEFVKLHKIDSHQRKRTSNCQFFKKWASPLNFFNEMSKGGSQLFNIFCPRESKHSTWQRVATSKKKLNKANFFSSTKMKSMFSWEETKQEFFREIEIHPFVFVCREKRKRKKERNNLQVSQKTIFLCFCDSSIWSRRARISSKRCTKVKRTRNKTSLSTYCDETFFFIPKKKLFVPRVILLFFWSEVFCYNNVFENQSR